MSYEHEQFLTTVAQRKARTSSAAAEDAARATLQTLAERLSAGGPATSQRSFRPR